MKGLGLIGDGGGLMGSGDGRRIREKSLCNEILLGFSGFVRWNS